MLGLRGRIGPRVGVGLTRLVGRVEFDAVVEGLDRVLVFSPGREVLTRELVGGRADGIRLVVDRVGSRIGFLRFPSRGLDPLISAFAYPVRTASPARKTPRSLHCGRAGKLPICLGKTLPNRKGAETPWRTAQPIT
ncbi:hypothetical protein JPH1_23270 [Mycobacterium avium subsp. hominissuis]|uniref:Uncharacterized protein n=1 Tax=Mycobacterium avium subsp. hominissuis TaxID=439334 RepID=A0AAI8X2K0_MYCAV|nr:hypothetical protein JPH1_23270 [Mycobacterium avium subsp. hominissuis]